MDKVNTKSLMEIEVKEFEIVEPTIKAKFNYVYNELNRLINEIGSLTPNQKISAIAQRHQIRKILVAIDWMDDSKVIRKINLR